MTRHYSDLKTYVDENVIQIALLDILKYIERRLENPGATTLDLTAVGRHRALCTHRMGDATVKFYIDKVCGENEAYFIFKDEEYSVGEMAVLAGKVVKEIAKQDKKMKAKAKIREAEEALERAERRLREAESGIY